MKNRIVKTLAVMLMLLALMAGMVIPASAEPPYESYFYNVNGVWVGSANAYSVSEYITPGTLGVEITSLTDMVAYDGKIFVLDKGSADKQAKIIILDQTFKVLSVIDQFVGVDGQPENLSQPEGIEIYKYLGSENDGKYELTVCDTRNARIVRMDTTGKFVYVYEKPDLSILDKNGEEQSYVPKKVVFDNTNRLYVIAENINQGLLCLDPDGSLNSFFGAPEVTADMLTRIWKKVLSLAGSESLLSYTPTEYSNIVSDAKGFVYGTIAAPDIESFQQALTTLAGDPLRSTAANVVRLNAAGEDILKRMGYVPNCGDLILSVVTLGSGGTNTMEVTETTGFVDVALGTNGIYSCLDRTFGRIFTYDEDGNLLFIFGNGGNNECAQVGAVRSPAALIYQGDNIVVMDSAYSTLTVYSPTDYGAKVIKAAQLYYDGEYEASEKIWAEVLVRNSNMYYAYIGTGKALYRNGEYAEAMKCFREVENRENYSKALELYMKESFGNSFGIIVVILLVLFVGTKVYSGVKKFRAFMRNGVKKVM
ncbi:MAG: hypothetical protein IJC53_08420 [Clostridia bacterium]|nr:hypothetical protein [Clostridia bacterium]